MPIRGGGLGPGCAGELLSNPQIIGYAVEHYGQHCPGEPAIVFACNRKHAEGSWRSSSAMLGGGPTGIDGNMDDS